MRTPTPRALRVSAIVAILLVPPAVPASSEGGAGSAPSGTFDDAVTVTGTRIEVPIGTSGRSVEVLTREEIAAHGVRSVPELLQLFPGLDVRRRGVYGVQADLSIRGSSFEQVQVLLDGVPMGNPQTGHHTLDLPVPVDAIERVEVLYGPGSALYGANAAGGVVHIITRAGAEEADGAGHSDGRWDASAELFAGEHSLGGGEARVSWDGSRVGSHRLSVERVESDGYRPGTEFDQGVAFYRGSLGPVELTAGASDRDFGAQSFYTTRFPDQIEFTEARFARAGWSGEVAGTRLHVQAAGRWHDDLFILDRHDPDLLTNRHEDRSLDLQLRAVRETRLGTVQAGTGWVDEDLESTNLGSRERKRWGSFAALVGERGRWGWRGAVHADRLERPGSDGQDWEVHPALALSVRAAGGRFRASAASAYRLPSFTELHYRDPASVGNPELEPEHSWTYEVGYDRVRGTRRVGATLFERRGRDLIDFVRAPGQDLFRAVNLRRVETRGAELVAARRLSIGPSGSRRPVTVTGSYTYLDSSGDEPAGDSAYVFDYLEHRAVVRIEGRGPVGLDWGLAASYNRRHEGDTWARLDVRLARRFEELPIGALEVFAEVENLADERYVERGEIEMPGRWAVVGVRLGAW